MVTEGTGERPAASSVAGADCLADRLPVAGSPQWQRLEAGLPQLGAVDRAVYRAIASVPTPALDEPIRLITTDHAFYLRRIAHAPFHPPGTAELAKVAAGASAEGTNCVILARHGCSVMADTVELAHKRALYLEEAATLTLRAISAGVADRLPGPPQVSGA